MKYDTLIVDGPYLTHRSYSAPYKLTTSNGLDATLIHGSLRSLHSFYKKFHPAKSAIAWESRGESWRRVKRPDYKPSKPIDFDYIKQLQDFQALLYLFRVPQYNSPTNEADDVIAKLVNEDEKTIIFTSDKDIMQLVTENCHVFNGKTIMEPHHVTLKFGVDPPMIPDLLAITGDKSDNIQGLKGYGPKKAAKILNEHGYIEYIPEEIFDDDIILQLYKNKELTKLNDVCELHDVPSMEPRMSAKEIFEKYELKTLIEKLDEYRRLGESWKR